MHLTPQWGIYYVLTQHLAKKFERAFLTSVRWDGWGIAFCLRSFLVVDAGSEVLEDVLEKTFWSPWPWSRRSSPWPWPQTLKSSKFALSSARGQHYFWVVESLLNAKNFFCRPIFFGDRVKKKFEDIFFENTCVCFLGPWPWLRAYLSLASRGSVLGRAVLGLGLGFFCVFGLGLGFEPCVFDSTSG